MRVYEVASFYTLYMREPIAENLVSVCTSKFCHNFATSVAKLTAMSSYTVYAGWLRLYPHPRHHQGAPQYLSHGRIHQRQQIHRHRGGMPRRLLERPNGPNQRRILCEDLSRPCMPLLSATTLTLCKSPKNPKTYPQPPLHISNSDTTHNTLVTGGFNARDNKEGAR
jgi:hypothetical protein